MTHSPPMGACHTENVTLHLGLGRELWTTGFLSGLHLHAFKDYRERNINALVVSVKLKKKCFSGVPQGILESYHCHKECLFPLE